MKSKKVLIFVVICVVWALVLSVMSKLGMFQKFDVLDVIIVGLLLIVSVKIFKPFKN